MKKVILLFFLVLAINSLVTAQVKVYKGNSTYTSDVIYAITDGKVYRGTSSYTSDIEFTIIGNLTIEEFVAVWYAVK